MAITTFPELLVHLGRMVTFEAENPGDASVGVLQTVISLAERRIYRDVRSGYNEAAFSGNVTGNVFTLPADFRSASLLHFGGKPLEPVSIEFLQQYNDDHASGDCRYFAQLARTFKFGPAVADGTALQGTYFKALDALSDASLPSNTLFAAAEDLYLFAAMVEAAPLYGFQDQIDLWNAKYLGVKDSINQERMRASYSAGRMKRRPSTQIIR